MKNRRLALILIALALSILITRSIQACDDQTNETICCCNSSGSSSSTGPVQITVPKGLSDDAKNQQCQKQEGSDWYYCDTPSSGSCSGVPVLQLSPNSATVFVGNIPIALSQSKGPNFAFSMKYSSRDDRDRNARKWRVGYRWSFGFDCSIQQSGNTYTMANPSGVGATFVWNGSNFVEQESWVNSDVYSMSRSGSNIVVSKRIYGSMSPGGAGCQSCGGGASYGSQNVNLPYSAWSTANSYTLEPDQSGTYYRLKTVTAGDGYSMNLYYDTNNSIASMVTALGNVIAFLYSTNGFLTNVTDVTGNRCATFAYSNDCLVQVSDTVGQTFKYQYDANGMMISLQRPFAPPTLITYQGTYQDESHMVSIIYPEGHTNYVRFLNGIMYNNLSGLGEGKSAYSSTSMGWNLSGASDPFGRTKLYQFYDNTNATLIGRVQQVVSEDGTSRQYSYDSRGNMTKTLFFDASSNLVTRTDSSYAYFAGTDYMAAFTNAIYDINSNLLSRASKEYSYSNNGTTNTGNGVYTIVSEKKWITANQYSETKYVWDTNAWLLSQVQQLVSGTNNYRTVQTYTYNANRQVASVQDALGNTTYPVYDSLNRLIAVTNAPNGGTPKVTQYAYDSLDRLTNMIHPDGVSESWTWAPCGCGILSHTDRGGNVTTNSYNLDKLLSGVRTWSTNGTLLNSVQYLYNSNHQVTNTIDAVTNIQQSVYDSAGDLVQNIDPLGRTTQYLYDYANRQFMTIYPDGSVSSNSYDIAGRLIETASYASVASASPLTYSLFAYDSLGRLVTTTDALGNVTSNSYDLASRTIMVTYPDGSFSETEYDLLGNVIEQIAPVPAGATQQQLSSATTSNSYDVLNRLVTTTDPAGRTTSYEYSSDWPQSMAQTYDANNQVVRQNFCDPLLGYLLTNVSYGVTIAYSYDLLGQNVQTIWPDGTSALNTYDGTRLVKQTSRTGNTTGFGFDLDGRTTSMTNSLGAVTLYFFDAAGNRTNVIDALTNMTFSTFDSMNRLTVTTRPDGSATTNTLDQLGRLISKTGAGAVPVSYGYDADSRMTALIDGMTNTTTFQYDQLSRLIKKTYADGSFCQYAYNARGWLTNRLDAKGLATGYAYNNDGQLTNINYATDTDVQYFLDILGRATGRVDSAGIWSWTYDGESSRVLSETLSGQSAVSYSYAPNTFDLASVGSGSYTTLYFWAAGRLTNVTAVSANSARAFSYSYKPNSDLLQQTAYLGGTVTVDRAYDILDRLTSISAANNSTTINSFAYQLDSLSRRVQRTDMDNSQTQWKYDNYDQLTNGVRSGSANGAADAAYNFAYTYDKVGNRLQENRGQLGLNGSFNNLNQLTHLNWGGKLDVLGSVGSTGVIVKVCGVNSAIYNTTNYLGGTPVMPGSNNVPIVAWLGTNATETNLTVQLPTSIPEAFSWDANGNMISDGQRTFTWDNENRLTSIETIPNVGAASARRRSEYLYDAQSRRIQKIDKSAWNGAKYSLTNVTKYVWDSRLLLAELNADNSLKAYNVHGLDLSQSLQDAGGIGGLLFTIEGGTNYLFTFDGNGNVIDVLDINTNVIAHYEYDPFGRTVAQSGSYASQNPWRFSTKQIELAWDLYYYGYRFYSPNLHIWLNRDPIGDHCGLTLYGSMGNNAVNRIDCLGLWVLLDQQKNTAGATTIQPYRTVKAEKDDEDMPTLLTVLKDKLSIVLDQSQAYGSSGWLRKNDDSNLITGTDKIKKNCTYRVPNTVVVTLGFRNESINITIANSLISDAISSSAFSGKGYNIVQPTAQQAGLNMGSGAYGSFVTALSTQYIAFWIHGGHGQSDGSGLDLSADGISSEVYTPTQFGKMADYKLSSIYLFSCNAGLNSDWKKLVPDTGAVYATKKEVDQNTTLADFTKM